MNSEGAGIRPVRAAWVFLLAYITITVVATAFSLAIESRMHVPDDTPPLSNPAYLLAEKFFPLLNLFVWWGSQGCISGSALSALYRHARRWCWVESGWGWR